MEHEVARWAVWGGAARRRAEVAEERRRGLPVLAYHRVADDGPQALSRYRVGPDAFEAQIELARRRHGYRAVGVSTNWRRFVDHAPIRSIGRPVMITLRRRLPGILLRQRGRCCADTDLRARSARRRATSSAAVRDGTHGAASRRG